MLIYADKNGHELVCHESASEAFIAQLASTEFGTSELRYRRLDCEQVASRLDDARFLELTKRGELIGTYMFCPQRLAIGDVELSGTYRGLLTVAPEHRSSGVSRLLVREALAWLRQQADGQPHVTFGCIDLGNQRSIRLLQSVGVRQFGELRSMLVYRHLTARSDSVDVVDSTARITEALQAGYGDCGLRPLHESNGPFYGIADGGTLVAGARAELVRLNLAAPDSYWPRVYGAMIDVFPPGKRRFDPREFRYVRLFDVVARENSAAAWRTLLKDILDRHGAHMAMFVMDPRRETYAELERAGLFGRLSRLTRQNIAVVGNALHPGDTLIKQIIDQPLAIGPPDI
ncbi:MAG: GNAT family N-acetyltransferase [Woeseiaceae bacterium]|nr:GNAT family N-acetyltransferase [Woeseiaceae bacterium]